MTQPLTIAVGGHEVPHWAAMEEHTWEAFEDFPAFMALVWAHLGLPEPTKRQLQIARHLQRVSERGGAAEIVRAFRGIGKS
jgi:hypothetical protein